VEADAQEPKFKGFIGKKGRWVPFNEIHFCKITFLEPWKEGQVGPIQWNPLL
jgi:hypothetical protein